MNTWKTGSAVLAAAVLAVTSGCQSGNGDQADEIPNELQLATFEEGSSWYAYGATFAELLRAELDGTTVQVLPFAGGG